MKLVDFSHLADVSVHNFFFLFLRRQSIAFACQKPKSPSRLDEAIASVSELEQRGVRVWTGLGISNPNHRNDILLALSIEKSAE